MSQSLNSNKEHKDTQRSLRCATREKSDPHIAVQDKRKTKRQRTAAPNKEQEENVEPLLVASTGSPQARNRQQFSSANKEHRARNVEQAASTGSPQARRGVGVEGPGGTSLVVQPPTDPKGNHYPVYGTIEFEQTFKDPEAQVEKPRLGLGLGQTDDFDDFDEVDFDNPVKFEQTLQEAKENARTCNARVERLEKQLQIKRTFLHAGVARRDPNANPNPNPNAKAVGLTTLSQIEAKILEAKNEADEANKYYEVLRASKESTNWFWQRRPYLTAGTAGALTAAFIGLSITTGCLTPGCLVSGPSKWSPNATNTCTAPEAQVAEVPVGPVGPSRRGPGPDRTAEKTWSYLTERERKLTLAGLKNLHPADMSENAWSALPIKKIHVRESLDSLNGQLENYFVTIITTNETVYNVTVPAGGEGEIYGPVLRKVLKDILNTAR